MLDTSFLVYYRTNTHQDDAATDNQDIVRLDRNL